MGSDINKSYTNQVARSSLWWRTHDWGGEVARDVELDGWAYYCAFVVFCFLAQKYYGAYFWSILHGGEYRFVIACISWDHFSFRSFIVDCLVRRACFCWRFYPKQKAWNAVSGAIKCGYAMLSDLNAWLCQTKWCRTMYSSSPAGWCSAPGKNTHGRFGCTDGGMMQVFVDSVHRGAGIWRRNRTSWMSCVLLWRGSRITETVNRRTLGIQQMSVFLARIAS